MELQNVLNAIFYLNLSNFFRLGNGHSLEMKIHFSFLFLYELQKIYFKQIA